LARRAGRLPAGEPPGVAALITEGIVVILAVLVLSGIYRASPASRPWVRGFSAD
jgi:hypothetical protein